MKRLVLIILLVAITSFIGYVVYLNSTARYDVVAQTTRTECGTGLSMYPTIKDNQCTVQDITKTPQAGNIVAFVCSERCKHLDGTKSTVGLVKRLIKIRADGAWWVQGDNQPDSWDSIDYGWILPSERSNVGVVTEIIKQ